MLNLYQPHARMSNTVAARRSSRNGNATGRPATEVTGGR
jgi:hypothetical protein